MKLGVVAAAAAAVAAIASVSPAQADTTTSHRSYTHGSRVSLCVMADDTENVGSGCWNVAPGAEITVSVADLTAPAETVGLRYEFRNHDGDVAVGVFCGSTNLVAPAGATELVVLTQDPVAEQIYDPSLRSGCGGFPTRGVLTATGVLPGPKLAR